MKRDTSKRDINLSNYDIKKIQTMVIQSLKAGQIVLLLNTLYKINLIGIPCTNEDLITFSARLYEGFFSNVEMQELFKSCISNNVEIKEIQEVTKEVKIVEEKPAEIEPVKETLRNQTRTITELKVGDIVHVENLYHPFLILNVYKSGLFKAVSLSTKPDSKFPFEIKCRFFPDITNYVRLTVSIYQIEEFKSKWVGSVSQSQVKLVKTFLESHKL